MTDTFNNKVQKIKNLFLQKTDHEKYELILEMGKNLSAFAKQDMNEENRVEGCQSTTYVKGELKNGKIYLKGCSDALISAGLAALLIKIYNEEPPEIILNQPPEFLKEINIQNILSPLRASGMGQMYKQICFSAQKFQNGN